jgi:ADP-ribose pyrophosphatase YjhB (NUDIX family)
VTTAPELPNPDWTPDGWHSPSAGGGASDSGYPGPQTGWLTDGDLAVIRAQMPMVYINVIPVRIDTTGDVTEIGLLLRIGHQGLTRAIVAGRVLYHERIRDAIHRHIENDLGPMALPVIPSAPQPFTVAEYLPTPGITPFYDNRQHAVALAYIVPITGDCHPRQNAIQIDWVTPEIACDPTIQSAFEFGQGALVRQAIAHLGRLP